MCAVAGPGIPNPKTGDDAAQQLEAQADELEHHLDELQDHIEQADKSAAPIREAADPASADRDSETTTDAAPEPLASIEPTTEPDGDARPAESGESGDDAGSSDTSGGGSSDDDAVGGPTPGHASGGDD